MMRTLLALLMVIGVFAGLNSRALALDCGQDDGCREVAKTCCVEIHDASLPQEKHHQGDGCPMDHHHHHVCCSHGLMLGTETAVAVRLAIPQSTALRLRPEADSLPEDPFLGSEKPPLI